MRRTKEQHKVTAAQNVAESFHMDIDLPGGPTTGKTFGRGCDRDLTLVCRGFKNLRGWHAQQMGDEHKGVVDQSG